MLMLSFERPRINCIERVHECWKKKVLGFNPHLQKKKKSEKSYKFAF